MGAQCSTPPVGGQKQKIEDRVYRTSELPTGGTFVMHSSEHKLQYYFIGRNAIWAERNNAGKYAGLYGSIDGGETWKLYCYFFEFHQLFVHPQTGALYAAISDEWLANDQHGDLLPHYSEKVVMSDEGKWHWKDITGKDGRMMSVSGFFVDPDHPDRVAIELDSRRRYILQSVDDNYSAWTSYTEHDWNNRNK
jgi:hypothetical protein